MQRDDVGPAGGGAGGAVFVAGYVSIGVSVVGSIALGAESHGVVSLSPVYAVDCLVEAVVALGLLGVIFKQIRLHSFRLAYSHENHPGFFVGEALTIDMVKSFVGACHNVDGR